MNSGDHSQDPIESLPAASDGGNDRPDRIELDFLSMLNYQTLVESLPVCLLIKDTDGRRLYANPAYLKYRQMTAEQMLGKTDEELFPAEIAERYRADDLKVIRSGKSIHGIEKSRSSGGKLHWIERFKCPLWDIRGNLCGVQLLFWDVTARVRAQRLRNRERRWLQTLMDNMPDSIYFKDRDSRFVRVGAGMAKKFGLPNSDAMIGLSDADVFSREHAESARRDELEIIRSGQPIINRVERETWPDRNDTWCTSTKLPLRDSAGKIIGTFGISRDITAIKRAQDDLAAARDDADRANRAKSDFLANMSHEIRTPMNAIIGMSELLAQTQLNREQREFLDLVRDAADSLLRLLNDILDFSKIEACKLELESIPFSLRDLIGKTGQTLSLKAAEKGLELVCRVAPDIPDALRGDPGRLRQVLINLIGNAIKFTDQGEVFVNVALAPHPATEQRHRDDAAASNQPRKVKLLCSVRDTGIGIPQDKQQLVMAAFSQADSSTTRRYGGTGLGLAICSQLAKLMDGDLWLQSEVGQGSTFHFTCQFELVPGRQNPAVAALESLHQLPVLVVDDNATNRRILDEVFTGWRFAPTLVSGGEEALQELRRAIQQGRPYRLAVIDYMMPVMDGFVLAERIRNDFGQQAPRVIILSSATRLSDAERCQRAGVLRYLTKPVVQSELLDAILHVMRIASDASGESPLPVHSGPALRVLVAEDGKANQIVARGLLESTGHQVTLAADGIEAIRHWRQDQFDAILMDMHMPRMDGLAAAKEIRRIEAEQQLAPTPIIAVTAAAMDEDTQMCLDAGMDAFLAKPLQVNVMLELLARIAAPKASDGGTEARLAAGPRPAAGGGGAAGSEPPLAADRQPIDAPGDVVVDFAFATQRLPGGETAICQLVQVFRDECRSLIARLDDALASGDYPLVQRLAHTMKGSARLFKALPLCDAAQQLENAAREQLTDQLRGKLDDLHRQLSRVEAAVNQFLDEHQ